MSRMKPSVRKVLVVGVNLLGLAVLAGCALVIWLLVSRERLELRYTVTVRDPGSGRIDVEIEVHGLRRPDLVLVPLGKPEQMGLADLRAFTVGGRRLTSTAGRDSIQVRVGYLRPRIRVHYTVAPGMLGRHGHQGILRSDYGLVAGRLLFLVPDRTELADARVRFRLPAGWKTVHPWQEMDGGWLDPQYGKGLLRESLGSSSIGFGRFASEGRRHGDNTLALHLWPGWSGDDARRVANRAHGIFAEFDRLFHPRLLHPFTAILVPRAEDGHGVIAGYWSNGLGASTDNDIPSWSLFAHRIAHVLNRDYPHGTHLEPHERWMPTRNPVNWVNEGVAGFLEVAVPVHGKVFLSDARFGQLYDRYARMEGPLLHFPMLAREAEGRADAVEYLHYTKAPLVMVALDDYLRRQSSGGKDLLTFLVKFYAEHRDHRDAAPFFGDLATWTAVDTAEFFDRFARGDELVLPLWRDILAQKPAESPEVVARVEGIEVFGDDGYRRARDQERERTRLVREKLVALELGREGTSALPDELRALGPSLPAAWQGVVARWERNTLASKLFGGHGEPGLRRLDELLAQRWRAARVTDGKGRPLVPPAEPRWNQKPVVSVAGGLTDAGGRCLARLARIAATNYVASRRVIDPAFMAHPPCSLPAGAWPPGASFVTIRIDGKQRGCIGSTRATSALLTDVVRNAGRAAAHDMRTRPLTLDELDDAEVEVSVLGPLHPIPSPAAIRLGRDGILLERDGHSAVYLPAVPDELGWNLEETLAHLSEKAGLSSDAWREARLQTFETRVFRDLPISGPRLARESPIAPAASTESPGEADD